MKIFNKLMAICIILTLGSASSIFASEAQKDSDLLFAVSKYDMKDISIEELPENIQPIEINSIDEFEEFIYSINNPETIQIKVGICMGRQQLCL